MKIDTSKLKQYNNYNDIIIQGKNNFYQLSGEIRRNIFGRIVLAYHLDNHKIKYACKILEKKNDIFNEFFKRDITEMCILLQINHPNMNKTYEIISDTNYYYIIMEYCPYDKLFDLSEKEKRFTKKCFIILSNYFWIRLFTITK